MTEEEELFVQIIKDSKSKLMVLKLLGNFFNQSNMVAVVIRTKIIHNLFENNKSLDINKLELFHIQYTSSFIDLFQKLKKTKEQQYQLISDEIHINEDFIDKLSGESNEINFLEQIRAQSKKMAQKLDKLYRILAEDKPEDFDWADITSFSNKLQAEYYREVSIEQYEQLAGVKRETHKFKNIEIEKKLLGRLNKYKFRIKFACGLVCNNEIIEIYEFVDSNDKFVFVNNDKWFYLLNEENAKGMDLSKNYSSKNQILRQLKEKNTVLSEKLATVKTSLPKNVQEVLNDYLLKISSVNFLEEMQNVDEQTNILKTMLNINIK